jgi:outer membrane protein OmpA-like peptidoglycan-associated protein
MRKTVAGVLASVLMVAGPGFALAAAEPTAQDYVKEIQSSSSAQAAPPAAGPACDNGEARDDSGACPDVDESAATRGFTLFSGSMNKPRGQTAATAPTTSPTTTATRAMRPAQATASVKCGLLCDLKVSFMSGSAVLTSDSDAKLAQFAAALRDPALAGKRFEIGGHTDASGSPEKNLALSQARAEAVKRFLVNHGVEASRLEAKGYGSNGLFLPGMPMDPRNRRVEARVLN